LPLYLDKLTATTEGPLPEAHAIWNALLSIEFEIAERPVSSRMAWKLACRHFRPLLPVEYQDVLSARARVNWDTLLMTYAELLRRSNGDNIDLMNVATAVKILYHHTTHPPRVEESAPLLEVMYFFLMCDYAKLPLKKLYGGQDGRGAGLFRFCKYCWRTAIPGRLICNEHASVVVDGSAEVPAALATEAKTPASRRKQANRQKQNFDAAISELMTKEVMEFHESEFTADVLLPPSNRHDWLTSRRPRVAKLLVEAGVTVSDNNIIEHLLALLHDSGSMPGACRSAYMRVNTTIIQVPELIWPVLVRAESWLLVRDQTRKNWGGKRKNSGRSKSRSDLNSIDDGQSALVKSSAVVSDFRNNGQ
jgi:hypothetical protein